MTGDTGQPDFAIPIWSDQIGNREVLVKCSLDGSTVAAGSDTGILRVYDRTGKILWTIQHEGRMIRSVAISGNGEYVGAIFINVDVPSRFADGQVYYFDRSGNMLWNYGADSSVEHIAVSADGNSIYVSGTPRLYSFDRNGTLLGQNVTSGTPTQSRPWSLETTADGSFAAAGTQEPDARIYAFERNGTLAWSFPAMPGIKSVAVSSQGGTVSGAGYSHLYTFDRDGTLMWQFNSSTEFSNVVVSSDG
ncbi:MAG: PQQ-binding-like beta-propeller repeat protein, partial [Methanoregula sp.]